jgi:lipoprotein-releasing system ATP-binding protein
MRETGLSVEPVLRALGLEKSYPPLASGAPGLRLFRDLSLEVAAGEMVAIVGESGAGKSSLLHLLAALDAPTAGDVWCGKTHVAGAGKTLDSRQAGEYRNREIGYVWQFHYLLPEFTAVENVAMPLLSRGTARKVALAEARRWLERVGLGDRGEHRSGELSGGEQQRLSIARALITKPKLLLADEPTGDLDGVTAERVFGLLQELHREHALASVLVTHNLEFASRCDRVLRLRDGKLMAG